MRAIKQIAYQSGKTISDYTNKYMTGKFMLIQRALLMFTLLFLLNNNAQACRCRYSGPFITTLKKAPFSNHIIRGTIVGYGPLLKGHPDIGGNAGIYRYMKVSLVEIIYGKVGVDKSHIISIYGNPGFLCSPYITEKSFPIGNEYVFSIPLDATGNHISNCGEHWLKIHNEKVIDRGDTIPYEELLKTIKNIIK